MEKLHFTKWEHRCLKLPRPILKPHSTPLKSREVPYTFSMHPQQQKALPVAGAMRSQQTLTRIRARMKSIHNVNDCILFADWMKGPRLWFALWKAHSRKPPVGSTKIESENHQKDGVLLPQYFLSKPPPSSLFKQKD